MRTKIYIAALLLIMLVPSLLCAAEKKTEGAEESVITITEDIDKEVTREATKVKEELETKIVSLTVRKPFTWSEDTIIYMNAWARSLPARLPTLMKGIIEHSKVLGAFGTLILILFLAALLYSFIWQKRVILWIESKTKPLTKIFSGKSYPYFVAILDIITCALVPLILLGFYGLIGLLIDYRSDWFTYIGRLIWLWLGITLVSRVFKLLLTNKDLSEAARARGPRIYRWIRVIILYSAAMLALYWLVAIFEVRKDVIDLLSFFVSISIIFVLLLLSLKKKSIFSVLPKLDNPIYQQLYRFIRFFYYPLVLVTLSGALLWTFGYHDLGLIILRKIWTTTLAFIAIALANHIITTLLNRWLSNRAPSDENAYKLVRTSKTILLYATVLALALIILNLLGLFDPLQRIMSLPLMHVGTSPISFWTILKAMVIVISFYLAANLVQSYLDYKVYPALGVDPGLGLVLNTSIRYVLITIAFVIALNIIGIDFKVLLVFAGAIGIGIGLGLQSLAANVISGFIIIFGRKIRKGDWIEEDGRLAQVLYIHLRATKMKTRDNIEYLVPNANLTAKTIVNYSYSSPLVRIHLPVGVSYKSDPNKVREILMDVASRNEMTVHTKEPLVRFTEYADSSLNFELLVWINVRTTPKEDAMSSLYFTIFEEFKKHGIEIPFPQRDIHVKTQPLMLKNAT